jgi:hypothetical protein
MDAEHHDGHLSDANSYPNPERNPNSNPNPNGHRHSPTDANAHADMRATGRSFRRHHDANSKWLGEDQQQRAWGHK